jgi:hypothetical protein
VLGAFLRVGEQFLFQRGIFGLGLAARRVPAIGRISTLPSSQRT